MTIHFYCPKCTRDFLREEDFTNHRSPVIIRVGKCLSEKEMSKLDDPITELNEVWSTSSGHAQIARMSAARKSKKKS